MLCFQVNPLHRRVERSYSSPKDGLPQQQTNKQRMKFQIPKNGYFKSNLRGKIMQTKENMTSRRVYIPRLSREVKEQEKYNILGSDIIEL